MSSVRSLKVIGSAVFGALAVAAISVALLGSASHATASTSNYCYNQDVAATATCAGTARNLNAVYGSGDQHIVCVGTAETGGANAGCSSGPGQGVYASFGGYAVRTPLLRNAGGSTNHVYGVAYQP
jgi:hypothetical protein